jgi:glycosyl transferase family 1
VNVCFISHSARLGGAELVLLETIEVLRESGVGCYAVLPSQGPLLAELEKLHVPVLVTSYALWSALEKFSLLRQLRALLNMAAKSLLIARQAARWNCDILYSNTETVCVGAFAAALLGRPHVWHLHEFGPRMGLKFIFGERRSHGVMNRLSSLVIAPSHAVAQEVSTWLPTAPLRVVYLVAQNHLQDRVRFLGQLDDPMPEVRAADVALVCSGAEGFGRATAEAMLAGKPVIGADNTATAELIHDGLNGLLYRTGDAQDLAGKIDYLYRHPDVASQLGSNGQAWAQRVFTRDRYREQLLPLLTELLPSAVWELAT